MTSEGKNRKFRWFGVTTIAVLALAAVSVPLSPAKAYIGVDIGGIGIGIGGPYYGPGPGYYGYGPYYHHYYGYGPYYGGW